MRYIKLQLVLDMELESAGAFDYPTLKQDLKEAVGRGLRTLAEEYTDASFTMSVDIQSEVNREAAT